MQKQITLLITIGLVAIIIAGGFFLLRQRPDVNLTMSPSVASAKLDGKQVVHNGKFYVLPGKHTIAASFNGFANAQVTFTAKKGSLQTVTLVLVPNSDAGYLWLSGHPAEQSLREGLAGAAFHNSSQNLVKTNPLVTHLPYIGPGYDYRIDYGSTSGSGSDQTVDLYIAYYTAAGKQEALDWISQQGYDPASFNITYSDQTNSGQASQIDNPNTD